MAKVKIPGLSKVEASGEFTPYVRGSYLVQCTSVTSKPSEKSAGNNFKFSFVILEGPEQADGRSPEGRSYNHNVFIMDESHPSFEEYGNIGPEQLGQLLLAMGVPIAKNDSFDPEDCVERTVWAHLKVKEDKQGTMRNEVRRWEADEE